MWNNLMSSLDDMFDYAKVKKQVESYNKKVVKFWNDFFKDLTGKFED